MALRTKTLCYAWGNNLNAFAGGATASLGTVTLTVPETASRTFRAAVFEWYSRDANTAATTYSVPNLVVTLGANGATAITHTNQAADSGEHQSWAFQQDLTTYFGTAFGTTTTADCHVQVSMNGGSHSVPSAKLYLTYEYDDASATTRARTVHIPLDSPTGALGTGTTTISGIPNLDTLLPESTKSYKQIWFEIWGNEVATGTTSGSAVYWLDAEATQVGDGTRTQNLQSSCAVRSMWVRDDMTTNATHTFNIRVPTGTMTMNHPGVILGVTYTYDHSASGTVMNSLQLPFQLDVTSVGHTTATDQSVARVPIWVQESSPTLAQSGMLLTYSSDYGTATTVSIAGGTQTARAYTEAAQLYCGQLALTQRVDSGGAAGVGFAIARGLNYFEPKGFNAAANTSVGAMDGVLYLNYTSLKDSNGDGVHNHTTVWPLYVWNSTNVGQTKVIAATTTTPNIPESNYYIWNVGNCVIHNHNAASMIGLELEHEYLAGEGPGDGFFPGGVWITRTDSENGVYWFFSNMATDYFKPHPIDPNSNKVNIETARKYYVQCPTIGYTSARQYVTYHAITYSIGGTVNNYAGNGSGIVVEVIDDLSNNVLTQGTTTTNGVFSINWYDNTRSYFLSAFQDNSHYGRSGTATAS